MSKTPETCRLERDFETCRLFRDSRFLAEVCVPPKARPQSGRVAASLECRVESLSWWSTRASEVRVSVAGGFERGCGCHRMSRFRNRTGAGTFFPRSNDEQPNLRPGFPLSAHSFVTDDARRSECFPPLGVLRRSERSVSHRLQPYLSEAPAHASNERLYVSNKHLLKPTTAHELRVRRSDFIHEMERERRPIHT